MLKRLNMCVKKSSFSDLGCNNVLFSFSSNQCGNSLLLIIMKVSWCTLPCFFERFLCITTLCVSCCFCMCVLLLWVGVVAVLNSTSKSSMTMDHDHDHGPGPGPWPWLPVGAGNQLEVTLGTATYSLSWHIGPEVVFDPIPAEQLWQFWGNFSGQCLYQPLFPLSVEEPAVSLDFLAFTLSSWSLRSPSLQLKTKVSRALSVYALRL